MEMMLDFSFITNHNHSTVFQALEPLLEHVPQQARIAKIVTESIYTSRL
jgi:hypothetical protein